LLVNRRKKKKLPRGTRVIANTRGVIPRVCQDKESDRIEGEKQNAGRFDFPISAAIAFTSHNGLKY